jgi:phosphate transport system permease protein
MSQIVQTPAEVLRAPLTPIRGLVVPALKWGALVGGGLVAGIALIVFLYSRIADHDAFDLPNLAVWTFAWGATAALVFAGLRLFVISRLFADQAFTVLGVLATFFGLAMLLVFFAQLGREAYDWFTITPQLVQQNNAFLKSRVASIEANIATEIAGLDKEMQLEMSRVKTDAEKKEIQEIFEKEIKPERLTDLQKTASEYRAALESGYRENTSPISLFSHFMVNGPSREPQDAGIYPALIGSLLVSLITIAFAVPIGVGAALYLEEYKSNNALGRLIQININNLAGVPSVVYGILGGLVFVELIFKPLELRFDWIAARNVLGGGMTLALLTLPVVIVAAQEAIRAVPSSIRQGAYALGATHWQTIWRQVLPLAWPGIMTGTILALSRAIGEAAPLVLFGALVFVNQTPGLFSRFTVMPMQIFGWADRPQEIFDGRTIDIWRANAAMGCIVLLIALLGLNAVAIVMRDRAQKKTKW